MWERTGLMPSKPRKKSGSLRLVRVAVCVLASLTTHAAPTNSEPYRTAYGARRADTPGVLQMNPRISLAKVAVSEILPGSSGAVSMGTWNARNVSAGHGAVRTRIVRELPALWRMRLPEDLTVGQIDVQYELTAPDGRVDCLVAADGLESELRAEVHSVGPVVVTRDSEGEIIEGGLTLYLDLGTLRMAGRYTGTLTVTLNHF